MQNFGLLSPLSLVTVHANLRDIAQGIAIGIDPGTNLEQIIGLGLGQ